MGLLKLSTLAIGLRFQANTMSKLLQCNLIPKQLNLQVRNFAKIKKDNLLLVKPKSKLPWFRPMPDYQSEVPPYGEREEQLITDMTAEINSQIINNKTGRLFAIVHITGKQFKITETDLIILEGYWPPNVGDKITLDKVLLLGSKDFTLVGRPLIAKDLVTIDAIVIDKSMSHTKTHFIFRKRRQTRTFRFYKHQQTMIRINKITLNRKIDENKDVEGELNLYESGNVQ